MCNNVIFYDDGRHLGVWPKNTLFGIIVLCECARYSDISYATLLIISRSQFQHQYQCIHILHTTFTSRYHSVIIPTMMMLMLIIIMPTQWVLMPYKVCKPVKNCRNCYLSKTLYKSHFICFCPTTEK